METASTPARSSIPKALAGARNVNSFGCGVPRSVTAVSRLTTDRSAPRSTPKALPIRPDRAAAELPSKCTSPAKASVAVPPPVRGVRAAGADDDGAVDCAGDEDCDEDCDDGALTAGPLVPDDTAAAPAPGGWEAQAVSPRASAQSSTPGTDRAGRRVKRGDRTRAF